MKEPALGNKSTNHVTGQTKRSADGVRGVHLYNHVEPTSRYDYVDVRYRTCALPAVVCMTDGNIYLRSLVVAELFCVGATVR